MSAVKSGGRLQWGREGSGVVANRVKEAEEAAAKLTARENREKAQLLLLLCSTQSTPSTLRFHPSLCVALPCLAAPLCLSSLLAVVALARSSSPLSG